MKKVLFSDLDGTLLDLKSYSFVPSEKSVQSLKQAHVPLIFCSSKSRSEQEFYREAMDIKDPFIVENGSAIFVPKGYFSQKIPYNTYLIDDFEVITIGKPVGVIRELIRTVRVKLGLSFVCYFDLPPEEVSMLTGLDLKSAKRAMTREFSETILDGQVSESFNQTLANNGWRGVPGSKFNTIVANKANKGKAVEILMSLYQREWGEDVKSFGVGDSKNDLEMLQAVDDPYLVQRPSGDWAPLEEDTLKNVPGIGPIGWNKVVKMVLDSSI